MKNADVNGSHVWDECMEVAKDIIDGVYEDLTYQVHPNKSFGVTHYHHKSLKFPWSDKDKFVEFPDNPREFKHKFYIEI